MAYANGRLPAAALVDLPTTYSNAGRREQLDARAAASLTRVLLRAVAHSGANFQIYDAYRSLEEQAAMLRRNYRPVNRARYKSTDRSYQGRTWARKPGRPSTASPGYSNHGTGLAIDIHPGPIQEWLQRNGRAYGWTWTEGRKLGEPWHFVYVPSLDRFTSQGTPDVKAIQRTVGVTADGKFGTGTAAAVKLWQAEHGLEADGIPGPATIAKMNGAAAPEEAEEEPQYPPTPTEDGFAYTHPREDWDKGGVGEKVHVFDHEVRGAYLHWPGTPEERIGGESMAETFTRLRGYRDAHLGKGWSDIAYNAAVTQDGTTIELRGLGMEPGANGGEASNDEAAAILLMLGSDEDPSDAMIEATNGLLAQLHAGFPTVEYIDGHRGSPDADTDCPGDVVQALIDAGTFHYGGEVPPTAAPRPIDPADAAVIPTGKDALVALIAAPDFPLLRTSGHRCYYGPADGPIESVSGKNSNSLNPGDIDDGSIGLRQLQRRFVERGYSITVDGKYGPQTEKAIRNLQKLAGITVDGKAGPDTWYAAWLLPVQ